MCFAYSTKLPSTTAAAAHSWSPNCCRPDLSWELGGGGGRVEGGGGGQHKEVGGGSALKRQRGMGSEETAR